MYNNNINKYPMGQCHYHDSNHEKKINPPPLPYLIWFPPSTPLYVPTYPYPPLLCFISLFPLSQITLLVLFPLLLLPHISNKSEFLRI